MPKTTLPTTSTLNLASADVSVFERKGGPGRPAGLNPYLPHFEASYKGAVDGYGKALLIPCTYGESKTISNRLRQAATNAGVSVQTRFLPTSVEAFDMAEGDAKNATVGKLAYRTVPLVKRTPRKAKGGDTVNPEGSAWN